jgi:hypothetical protein
MSDKDFMPVDAEDFEMIDPSALPEGNAVMPVAGVSAEALDMPQAPQAQAPIAQPVVEEANTEEIDDGLRDFLGGAPAPRQAQRGKSMKHPRRAEYQQRVNRVDTQLYSLFVDTQSE